MRLTVTSLPGEADAGRLDGDAAFLLLGIVVGDGGALIDLADAVGETAVVEHPLGDGGLAGVDVGDDADVAELADIVRHGGGNSLRIKDLMIVAPAAVVNGRGGEVCDKIFLPARVAPMALLSGRVPLATPVLWATGPKGSAGKASGTLGPRKPLVPTAPR